MTEEQFRAVARALLAEIDRVPDEGKEGFVTGALMSMYDIGGTDAKAQLRPSPADRGKRFVGEISGRWM